MPGNFLEENIMRKHKLLFSITAALTVLLSGCASVDGENSKPDNASNPAVNSNLGAGVNNTISDNSSNSNYPEKCKIYKASMIKFSDEQLFDFFNERPECGTPQKSEYYSDESHRYEADGCAGYIDWDHDFFFWTDNGTYYHSVQYYLSHREDSENHDESLINSHEDLDFLSRDEALKAVQKELSERFGISPDDWYAFKFDTVKKEGVELGKQQAYRDAYEPEKVYEGDDLEKEKQYYERIKDIPADDFYYFNIKYKVDDMSMFMGSFLDIGDWTSSRRSILGPRTEIIYGRNGLEYVFIYPAYKVDTANYVEADIIPYDEARGLVQKKYDDLLTDKIPEVLAMNFSLLPIPKNGLNEHGNCELRPHYGFYTKKTEEYKGETYDVFELIYFDAVTGEELATEQIMELDLPAEWGFDL